ncbi:DUF1484 family protein [Cupriavidus sp. 2TAF22]
MKCSGGYADLAPCFDAFLRPHLDQQQKAACRFTAGLHALLAPLKQQLDHAVNRVQALC